MIAMRRLVLNPLTGTMYGGRCAAFAVMLAADKVARPLYGIAQADIVVEIPALTNGITRYMGIFACENAGRSGPYGPHGMIFFFCKKLRCDLCALGRFVSCALMH